ncbi:OmpH family outer membrane protein [Pelagibacteraceae bacterium]|jgi:outer membrane protein|nr:OmpH family outer membrane protein [Pelagibacteraceae bacterium]
MNVFKKITFIFIILTFSTNNLIAEVPHYLDFRYILNQSEAGKKAQATLKKKLTDGINKIQSKEAKLQEDEKKIIQQKKLVSAEDYRNKVSELRLNVSNIRKERNTLLESIAKQRTKARSELLKNLNPIMKEYMKLNKIRMVIDKKSMLLADENLDITKDIMKILNTKIKSIKLN